MHELDPEYALSVDDQTAIDVARWRKGERKSLIDKRMALPVELRIQKMVYRHRVGLTDEGT